jgi:glycosyltransferase involved in cell wall biosynthesis
MDSIQRKVDNILFAYGGRIDQSPSGKYYGNEINDILVNRYLQLGKRVTFILRKRSIEEWQTAHLQELKSESLSVATVPDYMDFKHYILNAGKCKKIVKEYVLNCDILIARIPSSIGYWAIDAAKQYAKPYMVEVVGCPWDALWNHSFLGKVLAPYAFIKLKNYVRKSFFTLFVTKHFLQTRYKSFQYQTGISDVIISATPDSVLEERILKIGGCKIYKSFIAGTLAGLDVPYKGHNTVLEAIAVLKSKGLIMSYRVAGKGTGVKLMAKAKKLGIANQLEIVGQLPFNKVSCFFDSLDIYIQPSKQEGLPRALIEAMSRACPCLGSRVGGIPELLPMNYCFPPGKSHELAKLILNLNNHILAEMATDNFFISKDFEISLLDNRRELFYKEFLSHISNKIFF